MTLKKSPDKHKDDSPIKFHRSHMRAGMFVFGSKYIQTGIVALITIVLMVLVEALYYFPSNWIHNIGTSNSISRKPAQIEKIIDACPHGPDPVCGINGHTYTNRCELDIDKVTFAYKGKCKIEQPIPENTTVGDNYSLTPSITPNEEIVPVTLVGNTESGALVPPSFQTYTNTNYKYEISLPKFAYFRGFATPDKKGHTLAIDLKDEATAFFETALVRVTYSRSGTIPPDTRINITLKNGTLSLDYDTPVSPKVQEIIDAITSTARSLD